jgi:hypothetical protein
MRKTAIAITTAALAISLTACGGSGTDAATRNITQVTDGVDAKLNKDNNDIVIRNIQVAVNEAGDASLIATIVNQKNTQDALLALAINQQQIKISPIATAQDRPVIFGGPSANATAALPKSGLVAGSHTPVSFFFGIAGTVSVNALVVNA